MVAYWKTLNYLTDNLLVISLGSLKVYMRLYFSCVCVISLRIAIKKGSTFIILPKKTILL